MYALYCGAITSNIFYGRLQKEVWIVLHELYSFITVEITKYLLKIN